MFLSSVKFTIETQGEKETKIITYIIMGLIFFNSVLLGSGGPPPPPPLFRAKNVGAVYKPPLVVGKNQSAIYAQISYVAASELNGRIDLKGTSTNLNGVIDEKNFEWQTPTMLLNVGLSSALSKNTALILNLGLNKTDNLKLSGFEMGFNFLVTKEENHNLRLGLGINIHPRNFLWYSSANSIAKDDNGLDYDPFLIITYNSSYDGWLFNPFVQFSYSRQTLLDTDEKEFSQEVYKNINVFTITPGLSYNWDGNKLITFGLTYSYVAGIENTKSYALTPLLQFSYSFSDRE